MATLYRKKGDPSELYLIHPFEGNPRKISCDPVAQRLLAELEYEPGVLHNREGDQIPPDLLWALWETGLIGTGDRGDEEHTIEREQKEAEASVPLRKEDIEIVKELIQSYTGQSRRSLEDVAESLGLTLEVDSATGSENHGGSSSNTNSRIEMCIDAAGVGDEITPTAFKEWYEASVTGPRPEKHSLSSETIRALVFLAQQTDATDVTVTGANDSGDIQVAANIRPDGFSMSTGTPKSVYFRTGDYLLPSEDQLTGAWDDEFPFVDWEVCSSFSVTETGAELALSTSVHLNSSGISLVHTGVDGDSGHPAEEFVARRHQTNVAELVLRRHIGDTGPFALPESRGYTEFTCSVEFHDLHPSQQNSEK